MNAIVLGCLTFSLVRVDASAPQSPPPPPPAPAAANEQPAQDPSVQANRLANAGERLLTDGDPIAAIGQYEAALQVAEHVPDEVDRAELSNNLRLELAQARIAAYEISRDVTYLEAAESVLRDYLGTNDPADPTAAQRLLQRVEALRNDRERAAMRSTADASSERTASTSLTPSTRRALVITGATLTALAGACAVGMLATLGVGNERRREYVQSDDPSERLLLERAGGIADAAAIATGVSAAALLAIGIPMIVVGKRRPPSVSASLSASTSGGALVLRGRF